MSQQPNHKLQIAMLIYPGFTTLDLIGPQTVFGMLPNAEVHLVWKNKDVIWCDPRFPTQATATFDECPRDLDILCVPGGTIGTFAILQDRETLAFLADRGSRAKYVTSVCTGSLILGAAGLLQGYRAACHWGFAELLPMFGATPAYERVVEDGNRITGGGVTAGIDFGLTTAARLCGEQLAQGLELILEYNPQPPFRTGSPELAGSELTAHVRTEMIPLLDVARQAAQQAAQQLAA